MSACLAPSLQINLERKAHLAFGRPVSAVLKPCYAVLESFSEHIAYKV